MITGKGRIFTADVEAVGLLPDIREGKREDIHIIHLKDFETGELFSFFDSFDDRINPVWLDEHEEGFKEGDILDGVRLMEKCDILIMHNISGYDALALEKATGFKRNHFQKINHEVFPYKTCDTLVMSNLLNPERRLPPEAFPLGLAKTGPHSIAAHGIRMGRHKPDHEDWTRLTSEMVFRVEEDVEIGEDYYKFLMKTEWKEQLSRPNKATGKNITEAYYVELRVAFAIARQAQRGFAFDVGFAGQLIKELDEKIEKTERAFRPHMPMRLRMKKVNEDYIEKCAIAMEDLGENPAPYENYMLNGDGRMSYAATCWKLTIKSGKFSAIVSKYIKEARGFLQDYKDDPPVHGPFTPLLWEEIPLGNRDAVKQILYKHGWRGVNYNERETDFMEENNGELDQPWAGKIDSESIDQWEGSGKLIPDWCRGISDWYILSSRRTQILNSKDALYFNSEKKWPKLLGKRTCRGLLAKARCSDTGTTAMEYYETHGEWPSSGHWRVPAEAFSCATNTFRMRHKVVVNIPSRGLYGKEMRKLFITAPGKLLLGCDGSGLELRMLAHFMDDAEYTKVLLEGDIHDHNKDMAKFDLEQTSTPDSFNSARDMAKKFIYMFLYGSGVPNLARQLGVPNWRMQECINDFKRNLPKLDKLLDRVQGAARNFGYLTGVDGRQGRVRSKHHKIALNTALNVLLQMTGSLVMKWAHVKAEDICVGQGVIESIADFPIVAHMHDEGQMEVLESEVEVIEYIVPEEEWGAEEKKQFVDDKGRIWSTPVKDKSKSAKSLICVNRMYHPIGDAYCKALAWAGEEFGLRCPTAGEYKIGENWHETH